MGLFLNFCVLPIVVSLMTFTGLVVSLRKRRRRRLGELATSFGLEQSGAQERVQRYVAQGKFIPAEKYKIQMAYSGTYREQVITLGDIAYTLGSGRNRRRCYVSFVVLEHKSETEFRWFDKNASENEKAPTPLPLLDVSQGKVDFQELSQVFGADVAEPGYWVAAKSIPMNLKNAELLNSMTLSPSLGYLGWHKDFAVFHQQRRLTPKLLEDWLRRVLEMHPAITKQFSDSNNEAKTDSEKQSES